eukprot:COSAG05_NODE_2030_length_3669_cov_4.825637_3_plen_227_part_00
MATGHVNPLHDEKHEGPTAENDNDALMFIESKLAEDTAIHGDVEAGLQVEQQHQEAEHKLTLVKRALSRLTDAHSDHQTEYTHAVVDFVDTKLDAAIIDAKAVAAAHNKAVARALFASMTEAPCSFHQATVYYALLPRDTNDTHKWTRWVLALLSLAMVGLQCGTAAAIVFGTAHPSCLTNAECKRKGTYCRGPDVPGLANRCTGCGNNGPVIEINETRCAFRVLV